MTSKITMSAASAEHRSLSPYV